MEGGGKVVGRSSRGRRRVGKKEDVVEGIERGG